jgi:predicted small integral membrane protein
MSSSPDSKPVAPASSAGVVTLIACIAIMLAGMLAFWYYPFPSGNRPALSSFILFWFRELLILATALVVTIYIAVAWLLKHTRR